MQKGQGGELERQSLHVGEDEELILLVVDGRLVEGATERLIQGRDNGVTGRVHGVTVKVSAGLPCDKDGGLPDEGEHVLETLQGNHQGGRGVQ